LDSILTTIITDIITIPIIGTISPGIIDHVQDNISQGIAHSQSVTILQDIALIGIEETTADKS